MDTCGRVVARRGHLWSMSGRAAVPSPANGLASKADMMGNIALALPPNGMRKEGVSDG